MNNTSNFLVGTIDEGITKNTKPWATPADSWEALTNMYQFRGRVVKKSPYTLLGQLSFVVSSQVVAASAQNFTANLFAVFGLSGVTIVPSFTTITVNGGANYTLVEDPDNPGTIIQESGAGIAFLNGSLNYLTGALALNFSANPGGNVVITFSYAYALPVMGLPTRVLFELNEQDTIGFDTRFAYRYSNSTKQFVPLPSVMATEWSGSNSQFFFTTNYAGAFWATNSKDGLHGWNVTEFAGSAGVGNLATVNITSPGNNVQVGDYIHFINLDSALVNNSGVLSVVTSAGNPYTVQATNLPATSTFTWTNGVTGTGIGLDSMQSIPGQDGIRYYGDLSTGTGWANYNPPIDTNNALAGALLIFPYRGYLVFLNTTEGNEAGVFNYGNRARWTQIGTPYYSLPVPTTPSPQTVDIDAARDDLFGRGGAYDAPTQEVIVGAAFVRDILVVRFERSTWRLRFVNNAQNPFVWERINIEIGSDSTFSTIVFDKGSMDVSQRGISIADANDVVRIDDKIPDEVFDIRVENDGLQRVYGIRTFKSRLNYWTIPSASNSQGIFPDKVLVFNYEAKTWANFDDCFTCFGYFYSFDDMTWDDLTQAWSSYKNITWGGGEIDAGYENIIAGNQQGFVLRLEGQPTNVNSNSNFQNGASLRIDGITNGSPSTFTSTNHNLPNGSWVVLSGIAGTTDANGVTLNGKSFKVINPSNAASTFTLQEWTPYLAGNATGASFTFTLASPLIPVIPGSVNINVGTEIFTDPGLDGILTTSGASTGTINYQTGAIALSFSPAIGATPVYIRVVSQNTAQGLSNLSTTGTYAGGGFISKTSNFQIQTKLFNFLEKDRRARLNRIDFYTNKTTAGEFQADVYADSSNQIINSPLSDNPRSNIVKTTKNPYQYGDGPQTIYRLYAQAQAQTVQVNMSLNDSQMAVPVIANSDLEILAMNFNMRDGGRLV